MRYPVTSFMILSALFGLAACGGEDAATGTAGPADRPASTASNETPELDPCALVTAAEIEEIIGRPPGEFSEEPPTVAGAVTFYSCRSSDIHIDIEAWRREDDAKSSYEIGQEYPDVEGLGLPAKDTRPLGDLGVLAGRYVLSVDLYYAEMDEAAQLEAAKSIARIVIDRLP